MLSVYLSLSLIQGHKEWEADHEAPVWQIPPCQADLMQSIHHSCHCEYKPSPLPHPFFQSTSRVIVWNMNVAGANMVTVQEVVTSSLHCIDTKHEWPRIVSRAEICFSVIVSHHASRSSLASELEVVSAKVFSLSANVSISYSLGPITRRVLWRDAKPWV